METPFFLVSRNGNKHATQLLLRCGAEVDHRDWERGTPLHGASENGHYLVTRLLLKFRANSNARNDCDWTPLHLASRTGRSSVARVLLEWGADVNALNDFGWTPFVAHSITEGAPCCCGIVTHQSRYGGHPGGAWRHGVPSGGILWTYCGCGTLDQPWCECKVDKKPSA